MHRTRAHLTKLPQMLHISRRTVVTYAAGAENLVAAGLEATTKITTKVAEAMTISYE